MRLEKSERHDQILYRSLELFLERGYDATSSREIAQAAGMSKANLYHHFPTKDDVLRGLLSPFFAEIEAMLNRHGQDGEPAADRRGLLADLMHVLLKYRMTFTLLETSVYLKNTPDLHDRGERFRRLALELLAGADADEESLVRAESALGAIKLCVMDSGHYQEETIRAAGLEAALRALGEGPA